MGSCAAFVAWYRLSTVARRAMPSVRSASEAEEKLMRTKGHASGGTGPKAWKMRPVTHHTSRVKSSNGAVHVINQYAWQSYCLAIVLKPVANAMKHGLKLSLGVEMHA